MWQENQINTERDCMITKKTDKEIQTMWKKVVGYELRNEYYVFEYGIREAEQSLLPEIESRDKTIERLEGELSNATFEYCECGGVITMCGELNDDGSPSEDCMECILRLKIERLEAEVLSLEHEMLLYNH